MEAYPHVYKASASAATGVPVEVRSEGLNPLISMPPRQYGGPGDQWSPETLLVASVADCYILTFRAIARASNFEWNTLECSVEGILDRVDNVTRFTRFNIESTLVVPAGTEEHKAKRLMEKAESVCLVSNSLNAEKHLLTHLEYAA